MRSRKPLSLACALGVCFLCRPPRGSPSLRPGPSGQGCPPACHSWVRPQGFLRSHSQGPACGVVRRPGRRKPRSPAEAYVRGQGRRTCPSGPTTSASRCGLIPGRASATMWTGLGRHSGHVHPHGARTQARGTCPPPALRWGRGHAPQPAPSRHPPCTQRQHLPARSRRRKHTLTEAAEKQTAVPTRETGLKKNIPDCKSWNEEDIRRHQAGKQPCVQNCLPQQKPRPPGRDAALHSSRLPHGAARPPSTQPGPGSRRPVCGQQAAHSSVSQKRSGPR